LYDRETGTLWYPEKDGLRGIQGRYFGQLLPKVDFEDTTWNKWRKKHPDSKLLQ